MSRQLEKFQNCELFDPMLCCRSLSCVPICYAMECRMPGFPGMSFTVSRSLLKLMSIKLMMPSNHLVLCHPLLLLPSNFPNIRIFSNELALRIRWPKYSSFGFSTSPSNEYSELISFRIDWFDLLAVQGTLKSSSAPQFKSISPLALSFLYGPTLTFIHPYWKNHSFDYMDLSW